MLLLTCVPTPRPRADVYEEEPLPTDSPLRGMRNVLLSPHNANASPSAHERVHWSTIVNLLKALRIPFTKLEGGAIKV